QRYPRLGREKHGRGPRIAFPLCLVSVSLWFVSPGNGVMDFRLPELGEGVYEAEFVLWLVKPGEVVKRGQALMEGMTDKATMEVPSPFAGSVGELRAEPGQQLKIGQVVLTYEPADATAKIDGAPRPTAAASGENISVPVPSQLRVTAPPFTAKA